MPTLQRGATGDAVRTVQKHLLSLGFSLPRYGADGSLGDETFAALNRFLAAHTDVEGVDQDMMVSEEEQALLAELASRSHTLLPAGFIDLRRAHNGEPRIRRRPWPYIDYICLHQTATVLGEKESRWFGVPVQVGVTRAGRILYLNDLDFVTYHGHGFNTRSVGIEIDGRYAGVEGDLKTFWRPKDHPEIEPTPENPPQLEAVKDAIRWIVAEVARNGGKVKYIVAHRQSSDQRRSDPGSLIWQKVALPMVKELSLEAPFALTLGRGYKIPREWDPASDAKY